MVLLASSVFVSCPHSYPFQHSELLPCSQETLPTCYISGPPGGCTFIPLGWEILSAIPCGLSFPPAPLLNNKNILEHFDSLRISHIIPWKVFLTLSLIRSTTDNLMSVLGVPPTYSAITLQLAMLLSLSSMSMSAQGGWPVAIETELSARSLLLARGALCAKPTWKVLLSRRFWGHMFAS